MFYADRVEPYSVCLKDTASSKYNLWIARLEVAPPKRLKKLKGTIYLLDSICGWVRMSTYLQKVYGYLVNDYLDIEEGRTVYLTGCGAAGLVDDGDKHVLNPSISEEYLNDRGNRCVWLSAALLVRKKNLSLSKSMIEGMDANLIMYDGLSICGHRGQKH